MTTCCVRCFNSFNPYETWCRNINSKWKGSVDLRDLYIESYHTLGIPRALTSLSCYNKKNTHYSDSWPRDPPWPQKRSQAPRACYRRIQSPQLPALCLELPPLPSPFVSHWGRQLQTDAATDDQCPKTEDWEGPTVERYSRCPFAERVWHIDASITMWIQTYILYIHVLE